jgi:hypothetical protein
VVIEILGAYARVAVRVGVVTPAKYARVRQVVREEVTQPVDAVARCPCLLAVTVEAVDSDDAGVWSAV